ncbi:MAG: protein-disulfide reductase DsbD family protein [bacterium]
MLAWVLPRADAARAATKGHVAAALVSEAARVGPGRPFWVAIELVHDPDWHTYWRNPGDSGLATDIEWTLPQGFRAGEIQWPFPGRIESGPLTSYGYSGRVLLPVEIEPPQKIEGSSTVQLAGKVSWLECADICVPGSADVAVNVAVSPEPTVLDPKRAPELADARGRLPLESAALGFAFAGRFDEHTIEIDVTPPSWLTEPVGRVELFPFDAELIQHAAAQEWRESARPFQLRVPRTSTSVATPSRASGVLISPTGWRGAGSERALAIDVPLVRASTALPPVAATSGAGETHLHVQGATRVAPAAPSGEVTSLPMALVFAFLGGLVLNLMPCVFPVLSIKVIGFIEQGHQDRRRALEHALVFALGVLVSFWALAGALMALRAGGALLGWGFQLQSPPFVVALAALFFAMALNLFDVFEISGAGVTQAASSASARSGWLGSFLSGCLATLVATPCTAPFMGAALGFALAQSPLVGLAIFTALGLGMALPYVVLVTSPRLMRRIPRPGAWMDTVRHLMGFLLMATVVWLAWVLSRLAGIGAVIGLLGALWLIGLGSWIAGRFGSLVASDASRLISRFAAVALVALGLWVAISRIGDECSAAAPGSEACSIATPDSRAASPGETTWEPWSPDRVTAALAAGRPVLVDATAAWCLSCQVNERVALASPAVKAALAARNVVTLRADWTHRDPAITQWLASFGRAGVPLYVLYDAPHGSDPAPTILPAVLTPQIVLDALARLT